MTTALHSLPRTFKHVNAHASASVPSPSKGRGAVNGTGPAKAAAAASSEPFYRIDTNAIRKKLAVQLGDGFWTYWPKLKEFLVGRLRRDEFEALVKAHLNTEAKRLLHNQLLTAILHNASSSRPISETLTVNGASGSGSAQIGRKRSRSEADADDGGDARPRARVQGWVLGMSKAARDKLKAELAGFEEAKVRPGRVISEMQRGWQGRSGKVVAGTRNFGFNRNPLSTPSCSVTRTLPNAEQLQQMLNAVAREHGLTQGAGETAGELMVLALEAHLENILHAAVQMKAHDRPPPATTITLATPISQGDTSTDSVPELTDGSSASTHTGINGDGEDPLTLGDLHALLDLAPHLHPHAGSAVFKLRNGLLEAEEEEERVAQQQIAEKQRRSEVARQNKQAAMAAEPSTSAVDPDADPLPSSKGISGAASQQFSLPPSRAASNAGDMSAKLEERSVEDVLSTSGPADWTAMLDSKGLIRAIEEKKKEKEKEKAAAAAAASAAGGAAGTPVPAPPPKKEKKEDSANLWSYIDPSEILRDVLG